MADTLRKQILLKLKDNLGNLPDEDPYTGYKFSRVEIGPLGEADFKKRYTAGIVAGEERKSEMYPFVSCVLPITVEFRMTVNAGDQKPGEAVEDMLGIVQRRIASDRTLGGLAVETKEVRNIVDLDMYEDRSLVGAVQIEVQYRHRQDDPYRAV